MKFVVFLLIAVSSVSAVSQASAQFQVAEASSKIVESLNAAIAKGVFIDKGKEFDLNQPVDLTGMSGSKEPAAGAEVEFQVGTKDGKPAFVTVLLPKQRDKLDLAVNRAILSGQVKPPQPTILMCSPGYTSVCVETGKDGKCTKYECSPPQ
jgi:hypothetical protein